MNKKLDRFYKFKRFLINLGIMNIPLAEYVFNLQHNRDKVNDTEDLGKKLQEKALGNIMSYLPFNQSNKLIGACKKFREGFKLGIDIIVIEIMKEILYLKVVEYLKFTDANQ